jgi:ABC-type dipeptide/oligopeptide/nickel transport system permease component
MNRDYIIKRLLLIIPTILIASLFSFLIIRLAPGDPAIVMLGAYGSQEDLDRYRQILGLDQPWYVQYLLYMERVVAGNWGNSIFSHVSVLGLVFSRFLNTLALTAVSMLFATSLGISIGYLAFNASRKGKKVLTNLYDTITTVSFAIPTFWFGLILILVFSHYLGWLPSMGFGGPQYLVLPALSLGMWAFGIIAKQTKTAMLQESGEYYVTFATSKGLPERKVMIKHVLRNALIPIVTTISLQTTALLAGAVVTETVFNYPGLGYLLISSIFQRDYPLIQGAILFSLIVFVFVNFLIDFMYGLIDPRIGYEGAK